jgi:hypothetical protein
MIQADQSDWVRKAPLTEFAINSSISESTGFAPFELNYTRMPEMMGHIDKNLGENDGVTKFVEQAIQNVHDAFDSILMHRVFQKTHADRKRKDEPDINEGDRVYLSTKDLSLPKGRAGKLLPRFIGPYTVLEAKKNTSNYRLDLPAELHNQGIHDNFHVSKLRPYHENDETLFPGCTKATAYDFGVPDDEDFVREIDGHRWNRGKCQFHVVWEDGDRRWSPLWNVNDTIALDNYLTLQGVTEVAELSRKAKVPKEDGSTEKATRKR